METKSKKPVFEQRLGAVRVSIWENHDANGQVFHNVTIVRRFKSGENEWSNSNSYTGLSDLALLREAVDLARTWLRAHQVDAYVVESS